MSVLEFCGSCGAVVVGSLHLDSGVDHCGFCTRELVRLVGTQKFVERHLNCKVCPEGER